MNQEQIDALPQALADLVDVFKRLADALTEDFYSFVDFLAKLAEVYRLYFKAALRYLVVDVNWQAVRCALGLFHHRPQGPRNPLPRARLKSALQHLPESVVRAVFYRVNYQADLYNRVERIAR